MATVVLVLTKGTMVLFLCKVVFLSIWTDLSNSCTSFSVISMPKSISLSKYVAKTKIDSI